VGQGRLLKTEEEIETHRVEELAHVLKGARGLGEHFNDRQELVDLSREFHPYISLPLPAFEDGSKLNA
jgi:hypothetical protein